jgi:site-specific recombinase XerD
MLWREWTDLFCPLESRRYSNYPERVRHLCVGRSFLEFMIRRGSDVNADAVHDWLLERLSTLHVNIVWGDLRCLNRLLKGKAVAQWKARHRKLVRNTLVAMQTTLPAPPPAVCGPIAGIIPAFTRYRVSLRRGKRHEEVLLRLDRWLQSHGVTSVDCIDHAQLSSFLHRAPGRTKHTCDIELMAIQAFFIWLRRTDRIQTTPEMALTAPGRASRHRPRIYSLKEIVTILDGLRKLGGWVGLSAFTQLHLIYACGLRISEAMRLEVKDVDLSRRILHIRFTKWGKSRQIPIGRRACKYLRKYAIERRRRFGDTIRFFVTLRGLAIHPMWLRDLFNRVCFSAGLSQEGRYLRIHDFRHSFAVHRLYKWYADGVDPRSKLMLLSAYMGHVTVESTTHYLQMGEDLMRLASKGCAKSLDEALAALEDAIE